MNQRPKMNQRGGWRCWTATLRTVSAAAPRPAGLRRPRRNPGQTASAWGSGGAWMPCERPGVRLPVVRSGAAAGCSLGGRV